MAAGWSDKANNFPVVPGVGVDDDEQDAEQTGQTGYTGTQMKIDCSVPASEKNTVAHPALYT